MLLKKISLNNIRSYEKQEIEFSEGSTLLSGDIGSGKTSILLGIEFALFGLQPGQRGASLLRNNTTNGGVKMEFEIDGKNIIVERTLKKGKTIAQDYCAITIDGHKEEIAVTELKNKVLELLNYPKEFSKKQNLLYKFTVYTPQEEMKQIILQDPETRINTLRHVFGIDKYKKIIENISILTSKIREEKRIKEGITLTLEQDKTDVILKENELETRHSNLMSIEKEFLLKKDERKKIQEEIKEVSNKIEEKRNFEQEVEKIKIMISNKNEAFSSNIILIDRINMEIAVLKDLEFDESKISQIELEISIIKREKTNLDEKYIKYNTQITSLSLKNQENESIKNKIKNMELCPTCLQNVDASYKGNVINKFDSNTSQNVKMMEELSREKKLLSERLSEYNNEIFMKEKQLEELKMLKIKLNDLKDKEYRLLEIQTNNDYLKRDIDSFNQKIDNFKNKILELSKFVVIFESKSSELEEALNQEKLAEIKVAELKREIEVFSRQIGELREKIEQTEKIRKKLNYLTELENWLSQKFVPMISYVEKNVMVKLKSEFSRLFADWFAMLVSENFDVRLRDDFTPIIEQHDYEIDYAYLSGGERTAVALAYRLALNQVINSLLSKIKTKDFVILDEPTDGFSDQQLDKMREVLDQLNIKQLIIVSHEQKMEGFVENVIRFAKVNGVSRMV